MLASGGGAAVSGGGAVESGAALGVVGDVLGFGDDSGVVDGEFGVTVVGPGWFGAVLGVCVVAPGVFVVAPGVLVVAPGVLLVAPGVWLVAPGELFCCPVPVVPGVVLRAPGVLPALVLPRPAPDPADCANAQQPHNSNVLISKSNLRVMIIRPPLLKSKWRFPIPMGGQRGGMP